MVSLTRRLMADRRGVSAVEFALVAPLLIAFYFGVAELTQAMMAMRKVSHVASTLGDLTAQSDRLNNAQVADIFEASRLILAPLPANALQARISSLTANDQGVVRVDWSDGRNMAALAANAQHTLPAGVVAPGQSTIMAEVTYNYDSPLGYFLPGGQTFSRTYHLRPRRVAKVERVS
ncbi:TadE/TadG family type IV pilus assembly protein [Caulobacter sp. NIBR2454]|uniref:TadE/TadG family type IV pilus assembly protein n=1 Tax=Caulobacter sp. NIBR2454 TaxID=3015996 RepID=UPI0022B669A2|nr:TadE/TadG family type IV pilus assembly protein [Caulobacter sp. NIBR2454]